MELRYVELVTCALVLQNVCVDARDAWEDHNEDPQLGGGDDGHPPRQPSRSAKKVQAALFAHVNKLFEIDPDTQRLRAKRAPA